MFIGPFKRRFIKDRFIYNVLSSNNKECDSFYRIQTVKDFKKKYKWNSLFKCKKAVDIGLKFEQHKIKSEIRK